MEDPPDADDIGALVRLAADTDDCLTIGQIRGLGFGKKAVTKLVRRGLLRRVFIGVYVVASATLTHRQLIRCALLALGPNAHAAGRTALELRGVVAPRRDGRIWIAVVGGQRRPLRCTSIPYDDTGRPAYVHVLRAAAPVTTELVDGVPAARPSRALVDAAARETGSTLKKLVREADYRRLLVADELAPEFDRNRRGSRALRAALPAGPLTTEFRGSPDSRAAHRLLRGLLGRGLRPTSVDEPLRLDAFECRPDILFAKEKLAFEADGPQHELEERRLEDEARDDKLAEFGIETVRFRTSMIRRSLERCLDIAYAAIERRRADLGLSS